MPGDVIEDLEVMDVHTRDLSRLGVRGDVILALRLG
jgi:hypothetical protein